MFARFVRWLTAALLPVLLLSAPIPSQAQKAGPTAFTLTGIDSHDGMIYQDGATWYWVGTRYGCGFVWQQPSTPWCGFGVWTATAPTGPWSFARNLFDPNGGSGAWHNESWQTICRGDGCFNPRMIKRGDGVWILWFNAPRDNRVWQANEFWAMGCNSPSGPCGGAAGPPAGGTYKPAIYICNPGGDYSVLTEGADAWLVCTQESDRSIAMEKLAGWWGSGSTTGGPTGLSWFEGVGLGRLPDGTLLMTMGANCPYCSATDTSYAVAPGPAGPWSVPGGSWARRRIDGRSCGGQPRTIVTIDGQLYQQIDLWYDSANEANAATRFEPLITTGAPFTGNPNGSVQAAPFKPFTC